MVILTPGLCLRGWVLTNSLNRGDFVKKVLVSVVLAAALVGWGCNGDDNSAKSGSCSSDCNGALAAAADLLCTQFDPTTYESGTVSCGSDCEVDTSECVELSTLGAQEFMQCSGAASGTPAQGTCDEGLHCMPFLGPTTGYCLKPCTTEGADPLCGDGVCYGLSAGNYCLKQESQRDQVCLENLSMCVEGAGDCRPNDYDSSAGGGTDYRCKIQCDGGPTIGTQNTCADGETCMQNPVGWYTPEGDLPCNATSDCGEGFECVELSSGKRCIKWEGWCGTPVGLCGTLGQSGLATCGRDADLLCTPDGGHAYCLVAGTAGDATEGLDDANGYCYAIATNLGVCVGICDSTEGNLNCGDGFRCVSPSDGEAIFYRTQQTAAGGTIPCTDDTACDTDEGFGCVNLTSGQVCSRPSRLCVAVVEGAEGGACLDGNVCDLGFVCHEEICKVAGLEGGPCQPADNSCNAGLRCDDGTCVVPAAGSVGGVCLVGDACDAGLVCEETVCVVPAIGAEYGACYANGTCDPGLACTDDVCGLIAEGADGGACFANNTCTGDDLTCVDGFCGMVAATGDEGGACYGNNTCNGDLACVDDVCASNTPAPGSQGGACYGNGTCDGDLACADDVCVAGSPAEGSDGGACYGNGSCDGDLVCADDVCGADDTPAEGSDGGACYGNNTCDGDLVCTDDVCGAADGGGD